MPKTFEHKMYELQLLWTYKIILQNSISSQQQKQRHKQQKQRHNNKAKHFKAKQQKQIYKQCIKTKQFI